MLLGFFLHWSPHPLSLSPSNPCQPPCHLHFSEPSSHLVFPKLTNPPMGSPGVQSAVKHPHPAPPFPPAAPCSNKCPSCWLPCPVSSQPAPPPPSPFLCSFLALMLGNQRGMPRPLPAYLNPPNSSKTSSRPSPLCAAS